MTSPIEQLKSQVGTLTVPERADLAFFLLSSLEPEEDGVETAWNSEIKRRIDEIRDGRAVGRSADEVITELQARYP